jgi:hypothetical protein
LDVGNVGATFGSFLLNPGIFLVLDVVAKEFGVDIELDREVASRDGLDVPLDVVVLLDLLDVVEVVDHEESDEDGRTAKDETLFDSVGKVSLWDQATKLKENLGFRLEARAVRSRVCRDVDETFEIRDLTRALSDTVGLEGLLDLVLFNEATAAVGVCEG